MDPTTLNINELSPQTQIAFNLPEGVIFNEATGEHEYYHLGEYIGEADTHRLANHFYHEYLRLNYDHARRNPANVIPVNGNTNVTEIEADWETCLDCGCCVDAGQVCECRQLTLCDDGYVIYFNGEPVSPPEPIAEWETYGLEARS